MRFKDTLKIVLRRSLEHVVPLFLLKTIVSVDQSDSKLSRGHRASRRVSYKSAILQENGVILPCFHWLFISAVK